MFEIVIDSREQNPLDFSPFAEQAVFCVGTLESGDYSVAGFENLVAVERKSLDDLLSSLGKSRERFFREIDRLRGYEAAALVIECSFQRLIKGNYPHSQMKPDSVIQSLFALMAQKRLPIFFAGNRETAARATFHFLRHYINGVQTKYRKAAEMHGNRP